MSLQQFFLVLYARRKLALIIFAVIVSGTLVVSLILPKEYTSTTSLIIDVKSPDPIAGMILPGVVSPSYMATQLDIIRSERVALRVVKLLGLDKNEQAISQWREATEGKGTVESYFANSFKRNLAVKPSRESNMIDISYSAPDPRFATALANAFAAAYIDITIDLRVEPARQYAQWFDERLKALRDNLQQAQARLNVYQQEKGIVVSDERLDSETARLNELNAQLAAAQGLRVDAASRQKSGSSEYSPDVMQNPLIQSLKSELSRAETRLSEASGNVGKNHPQYQQIEAQISGLKQQIKNEISRISAGATVANRFGILKESEIKAAIEEQKQRVFELRAQRDALGGLLKDVENAQRAYDTVAMRMSQTTLESQSQQTNVLVLNPAVEPMSPAKPRVFMNMLIAVFIGCLLGIGSAMAAELIDRRVRDSADLSEIAGMPMLGRIGLDDDRLPWRSWIARVRSMLQRRRSSTLVAGG